MSDTTHTLTTDQRRHAEVRLGQVVITRNALEAIPPADVPRALARHADGDWGDLCEEDRQQNELCLEQGCRLFSAYQATDGTKFWIITEADRSVTTVLLPLDCASCHDAD